MRPEDELSVDEIKDILIPQLKRVKTTHITITGGEPLVREDIVDVLELFSDFNISLLTNLSLCNKEKLDAVLKYANKVVVSLDPEEVHDRVRGVKGCFKKTVEYINYLARERDFVAINCVITLANSSHLSEMIGIAKNNNVKQVFFQFLDWQTSENIERTPFLENPEIYGTLVNEIKIDCDEVFKEIRRAEKMAKELGIKITTFPLRMPLTKKVIKRWYYDPHYGYAIKCLVPYFQVRISPYGNVMPCIECDMGNIKSKSLPEIWNNDKYRAFRKALKKQRLFPRCHKCCKLSEKIYNYLWYVRL